MRACPHGNGYGGNLAVVAWLKGAATLQDTSGSQFPATMSSSRAQQMLAMSSRSGARLQSSGEMLIVEAMQPVNLMTADWAGPLHAPSLILNCHGR